MVKVYDKKISKIYLNKLYKDVTFLKNNGILDENYLSETVNSIDKVFNLNLDEKSLIELKDNIKKDYFVIRSKNNVDSVDNKEEKTLLVLQNLKIYSVDEDNMLVIKICFEKG
jgi:hypothetical protein